MKEPKENQVSMLNESEIKVIQITNAPIPTKDIKKRIQFKRGTTLLNAGKRKEAFEDSRITMLLFEKYRLVELVRLCMICACTALTILEVSFFTKQYEYSFSTQFTGVLDGEMELILYLILLMSIVIILLTIASFQVLMVYQKEAMLITPDANLFETPLIWNLIYELIILLPTSTPFTRGYKVHFNQRYSDVQRFYYVNEILTYFMLARSIIVGDIFLKFYSLYNSQVGRLCRIYSAEMNTHLILKLTIRDLPLTTVSYLFLLGMFAFGYTLEIAERALIRTEDSYDNYYINNTFWVNMITIATIGYGDIFPYTDLGRFSMFVGVFYGVTCTSLFTAILYSMLLPTAGEMLSWAVLQKADVSKSMKKVSQKILFNILKIKNEKEHNVPVVQQTLNKRIANVEQLMQDIGTIKRNYRDIDGEEFLQMVQRKFRDAGMMFDDFIEFLQAARDQQKAILMAIERPLEFSFKSNHYSAQKKASDNKSRSQNPTGSANNTYEKQSKDENFFQNLEDQERDPYLMNFEEN